MLKTAAYTLVACIVGTAVPAGAQNAPQYKSGPWHYRSIACVDTTVKSVTPRLGNAGQTTFTNQPASASQRYYRAKEQP